MITERLNSQRIKLSHVLLVETNALYNLRYLFILLFRALVEAVLLVALVWVAFQDTY